MKRSRALLVTVLFLSPLFISFSPDRPRAEICEKWMGKVVSVQGSVHVLRKGETQWRPARLNETCCPGDTVRVLRLSRADVLLSNDSTLRLDQNTSVTFSEPEEEKTLLIRLLHGAGYFFSRVRRGIKILTPYVNATVEGTEFLVRVDDQKTLLTIFEGRVTAANEAGSVTIGKGQSAVAQAGQAPVAQIILKPRGAVQWTLYYPPTLYYRPADFEGGPPGGWQSRVRQSIESYMQGNLQQAFESLENVTEEIREPRFFTYRASLLLSVGRVNEVRADLEKALRDSPNDSSALALQSMIALVQNDKDQALVFAKKAVDSDPDSAPARMAMSYALQARFDLEGALKNMEEAVARNPSDALAMARLSEMWLSLGYLDKALEAANRAAALDPAVSRTQTVLGFARLAQVKTKAAKEVFQKAIEIDQADPLPRLGLGLAIIRDGALAEGRSEIEVAASLAPENSLIRSYLGKAYYEEKREQLASNQFASAKELDPQDPTPYFYDAILKQSINRPVEALRDLQESIELNDNRAIYRSRLLLDADLAARSASLARIYSDLGFQWLALVEGWKSVNTDPANFSAHRFLADSYASRSRHEIARVSELLQSQLLQPININPIQPHLAESSLFILEGAGPSSPAFNEFNPLFTRNRLALQASGIVAEDDTYGGEIVQSGVLGKFSYSAGVFHHHTDGYRENNDLKETITDLFAQYALSHKTSVQAEFRSTDVDRGDLTQNFFGDFLNQRQEEEKRAVRVGFRHAFSPTNDLIGSFAYERSQPTLRTDFEVLKFGIETEDDSYSGEIQHLFRSERFNVIAGGGHFFINRKESTELQFPPDPPFTLGVTKDDINHTNLYVYSQIRYPENVTFTVGGSADFLDGGIKDRNQFNPKIGVTWNPFLSTTLRGAIFKVVNRTLITNQTIEPTQVAGFNQFYLDGAATKSWHYGAAIDQKFSKSIYGGVEYIRRKLDVPFSLDLQQTTDQADWKEQLGRAYLYWTPHQWFGVSAEYEYEWVDREENKTNGGVDHLRTHRFPLGVSFYHPSGFSAQVKATYVDQRGRFGSEPPFRTGEDQFWTVDASVSYRLPKRFGILSIGVKNLFDESFKYQEIDPENRSPLFQPDRLIFGKFTVSF